MTNAAKISGAAFGVELGAGGSVTNKAGATISDTGVLSPFPGFYYSAGVGVSVVGGAGTVTNAGDIGANFYVGVELQAGGSVTNKAGGTIGGLFGINSPGAARSPMKQAQRSAAAGRLSSPRAVRLPSPTKPAAQSTATHLAFGRPAAPRR